MRLPVVISLVAAATLAAGCDFSERLQRHALPDTLSLGDRCADIMQRAMPFATIETGGERSGSPDVRLIVVHVAGRRTDTAGNGEVTRDLEAECTFTDNVLTAFRWLKGGPPPMTTTNETLPSPPPVSAPTPVPPPAPASAGSPPPPTPARPFH